VALLRERRGPSGGARYEVAGESALSPVRARGRAGAGVAGCEGREGTGHQGGQESEPGCAVATEPCPDGRDDEEGKEERGDEAPEVGGEGGTGREGEGQARHRGEAVDQGGGAPGRRKAGITPCRALP